MVVRDGEHRLVGFVDLGEGHDLMARLTGTNKEMIAYYTI